MSINYVDTLVSNTEKREAQDKKFNWWLYPFNFVLFWSLFWIVFCFLLWFSYLVNTDLSNTVLISTVLILSGVGLFLYVIGFIYMPFHLIYMKSKRVNYFIQRKKEWYQTITEFTINNCKNTELLAQLEDFLEQEVNLTPKKLDKNYLIPCIFLTLVISVCMVLSEFDVFSSSNFSTIAIVLLVLIGLFLWYFFLKTRVNDPIVEIPIKKSILWTILSMFFYMMPLNWIYYEMPINYLWNKLQKRESKFCELISDIWIEEGWIDQKIEFFVDYKKQRSMREWTFLSIITFGIVGIVWDYRIHTDPDNMYPRFYKAEDEMLEVLKKQIALQTEQDTVIV